MLLTCALNHGYVLVPDLVAEDCNKCLCETDKIIIAGYEWNIRYEEKWRILHGLDKVIEQFGLKMYDSIHFTFGKNGVFSGRIYDINGMEISYGGCERRCRERTFDYCFISEKSRGATDFVKDGLNIEHETVGNDTEIVSENMIYNQTYQFSDIVSGCNFDNRCHGLHIPKDMRLRNRNWKKGDVVKFRTSEGTWDVGIVFTNDKPRFSAGWSKFVRD